MEVNLAILKLCNFNDLSDFIGYDAGKYTIQPLQGDEPIGGAFKKIDNNDYWGFVDTKFRDIPGSDFFFFHNDAIYNIEDENVTTELKYESEDTGYFVVKIDGSTVEKQQYSRQDNFDPSGWQDESELDIFAIIDKAMKMNISES